MQPTLKNLTFTVSESVHKSDLENFVPKAVFQIENFWSVHPERPLVSVDVESVISALSKFADGQEFPGDPFYVIMTFELSTGQVKIEAAPYKGTLPAFVNLQKVYEGKYVK